MQQRKHKSNIQVRQVERTNLKLVYARMERLVRQNVQLPGHIIRRHLINKHLVDWTSLELLMGKNSSTGFHN